MTVPAHNRAPMPNSEDYRRLDPSTSDDEFYQEVGLPGIFTINLPTDDDMEYVEEDEAAGMEEDTAERTTMPRMSPRGGVNRRLKLFLIRGLIIAE